MPLEIAPHAGFCMGVRRAVDAAQVICESGTPSCTLGELIHNPQVVEELRRRGMPPIGEPSEAAGRQVLIRSHGVAPQVLRELEALGCKVQDLTCPFVDRLHRIVAEATAGGKPVIVVGERAHPEVVGTVGWAQGPAWVVATAEEAAALPEMDEATVCAQTTFPPDRWEEILRVLETRVKHLARQNTICSATHQRQQEARELAARSDAMIVVGGRHSANTRKLYESCRALCPRTILVECAAEIPPAFANIHSDRIGMTAGASTPDGTLKEVVTAMTDNENMNPVTPEETTQSEFEAGIESTMRRYRTGQTVTGTVISVGPEIIIVNIGGKSDGLLKVADCTEEGVKEGDEIEVEIVRVNDGEGNVVLSQRNVVNRKAWEALMAKYNAGEIVDGVGKEVVRGGLLADVGGVRAFVPASHLANHYVEKIGEFVGKDMRLKIIEVDEKKKRVVASRREAIKEENEARKKEAWDRLEEGMVITGEVRRLVEFGAFVDVGGVDGLIHITDLSWSRVKEASEVVKPGQRIQVKVLKLDPARGRISLGYKQLLPQPWDNVEERYPVDSIVAGKVVRITDFGCFVELERGLDGLVHISQCAPNKIAKVEDAVQVGQEVHVKVLSVDPAQKRISLSIRQALEDEAMDEAALDLPVDEPAAEPVETAEAAPEAPAEPEA
ncbi:MAG: bifunctional 4-hydroxy-3-methylbut-2-enyl diphosphate reductase/30S ribosomal protein S1 [Clostridia bacterium]|nr:bifunctional 4-hydroxy-3-methylbut-2-enyl diphosphate reductase/30S ribosomal protein S1 [Clostridia bacterium]